MNTAKANISNYAKSQFTVQNSKSHHVSILKEVVKNKNSIKQVILTGMYPATPGARHSTRPGL